MFLMPLSLLLNQQTERQKKSEALHANVLNAHALLLALREYNYQE